MNNTNPSNSDIINEMRASVARNEAIAHDLNERHDRLQRAIDEKYSRIDLRLSDLNELLTGNGSPERGIIVRMDRIEQNEKSRLVWTRAAIVTSISAFVYAIADYLFKGTK